MLIFLTCVAVYLMIALITALSFLAQYPWVLSKQDYAAFNHDLRIQVMITGSALSLWLTIASLMGICWPYVYFHRIKETYL